MYLAALNGVEGHLMAPVLGWRGVVAWPLRSERYTGARLPDVLEIGSSAAGRGGA
jgi:hypothetical protein